MRFLDISKDRRKAENEAAELIYQEVGRGNLPILEEFSTDKLFKNLTFLNFFGPLYSIEKSDPEEKLNSRRP